MGESCSPDATKDYGGLDLLPQHRKMLLDSAISPEVAEARRYRSISAKAELKRLGFSSNQARTPGLLIPVYGPHGNDPVLYQFRSDEPRITATGKAVKYETPVGGRMRLDVPPDCRDQLGKPSIDLYITEGVKKADSAVSHGLCCVALLGVWNFRGTNEHGGKVALPEWDNIALNDRKVYIVFDSDVMTKPEVHAALARLKALLEHRGAEVYLIYLPFDADRAKVGLDDYLADGNTVDDLAGLASRELKTPPKPLDGATRVGNYEARDGKLYWLKPGEGGDVPVPLTNFDARITADLIHDDGVEETRVLEIQVELEGESRTGTVSGSKFASMNWATDLFGPRAIVLAGQGIKDHARVAIQTLSTEIETRQVFTHTGFRRIGEEWVFLSASGGLGQLGQLSDVVVELPSDLAHYSLPPPPAEDELVDCVRASLEILSLGRTASWSPSWRQLIGPHSAPATCPCSSRVRRGASRPRLQPSPSRTSGRGSRLELSPNRGLRLPTPSRAPASRRRT